MLAEPELLKTALQTCWKINQDHLAYLVSWDREDFTYYQNEYMKKMILLYTREFRVPPRDPASRLEPWGGNNLGNLFTKYFHSHDLYVTEK